MKTKGVKIKMEIDEIPVGNAQDLRGQQFGRLTVLYRVKPPTPQKQRGIVFWKCKCTCGGEKIIRSASLTGGRTQSCGCLKSERLIKYNHQCKQVTHNQSKLEKDEIPLGKAEDLRGKKFGKLTVLYRVEKPQHWNKNSYGAFWKCKCDCGNETIVYAGGLKSGASTSCGCARKEFITELGKSSAIDLTGQKYGKLTVIKRVENNISNRVSWLCKCDCGNETIVDSNSLRTGNTKSCGCLNYIAKNDLTGQRFGLLTAICQVPKPKNYKTKGTYWKCKCDCGNEVIHASNYLQSGDAISCGKCTQSFIKRQIANRDNISGQKYGMLTAIKPLYVKKSSWYWLCKCDCGNEYITSARLLKISKYPSCGCNSMSFGVRKITELLQQNNCSFIKEFKFDDCRNKLPLPFDFYVDDNFLIEYDGIQHFKPTFSQSSFELTQHNDKIKDEYCKIHNIPLIRIPYWHEDDIIIEDLKPETSQFLI